MEVAALCVARKSIYKQIQGVDCYDIDRDASTFPGGMPVIAHPPCRHWSAYCRHQATREGKEAEMELGRWCVQQVRQCGGVLEQPAHSRLWDECYIPKPGPHSELPWEWSLELPQYWFGDEREKATWLFFFGLDRRSLPELPFRLKPDGGDRRIWQLMSSKNERERTPKAFAEWLVACARLTTVSGEKHAKIFLASSRRLE